ncbi:MAG: hypothetical protein LBV75_09480, partial [Paludibacter sp.]|nr:hypothetical protein [Paludibacter sp.]
MTFHGQTNLIKNIPKTEMDAYYSFFEERARASDFCRIKYLILGNITVKIENHVPELAEHIETQLAYCISDNAESYDKTFIIWHDDVRSYVTDSVNKYVPLFIFSKDLDKPVIEIYLSENKLSAFNPETQTYYLAQYENFSIDCIREMGHLFVKQIYQMAKTPAQIFTHSAAVGIDGKGVLLAARGGGGKSTLAISAMLDNFQYVSDDYSILNKTADGLYAYPIYSTVNMFPPMKAKMKTLVAEYMYNNYWHPQKLTMSIHAHHDQFVKKLPVYAVIFPKISDVDMPSIEPMDKGKAIVQMAHST